MNAISYSTLTFDRKDKGIYTFPGWSVAVGWCMASTSVTFIPVVMIYKTYRTIKAGKVSGTNNRDVSVKYGDCYGYLVALQSKC